MKLLNIIIAHGKVEGVFRQHLALWKRHGGELLVVCPKDDPVEFGNRLCLSCSEGAGDTAHVRLAATIEHAALSKAEFVAFFEYDSIYLDALLPLEKGFFCNVMPNMEGERFLTTRYANFPWIIDRESLNRMAVVARDYPKMTEHGHNDRWMAALAMLANVPLMNFTPKGFSAGTIDEDNFKQLQAALEQGARALHGIKHQWVLDYAMEKTCLSI